MSDTLLDLIGRLSTYQTDNDDGTQRLRYRTLLAPEGELASEFGDRRIIEADGLSWIEGRIGLMWTDTELGHEAAVLVGNFVNLHKESIDGTVWVVADDIDWDINDDNPSAARAKRLVDEERLNGISIHMRNMDADFECPEDETLECDLVVHSAKIALATVVAIPAFEDAEIDPVAAAAAKAARMVTALESADLYAPPRDWFNDPKLDGPTPLTVTEDGQIYGHLALWDSCHIGFDNMCVTPPRDGTDYAEFHAQSRTPTDDGALLPTGVITVDGSHADLSFDPQRTIRHYDSTATVGGYVRAGDDDYGPWIAGALAPDLDDSVVEKLRRLSLSGDWRPRNNRHILVAALAVPVPGFSIKAHVASGEQTALITMGPQHETEPLTDLALVASALTDVRAIVQEFRQDMEPLLVERRQAELEAALAQFD